MPKMPDIREDEEIEIIKDDFDPEYRANGDNGSFGGNMNSNDLVSLDENGDTKPDDALGERMKMDFSRLRDLIRKLGFVGKNLHDTYSEENQSTGEGFIRSIEVLMEIEEWLDQSPESQFTMGEKTDFLMLTAYLKGKLQRRNKQVDSNAVNY